MKTFLKKFIPKQIIQLYHYILTQLAVLYYSHPSRKMIIIGVTGTKGKSTTSYLTAKMLEHAGFKVGLSSTIMFKIARKEWLNTQKMTMVGRFQLQGLLSKMLKAGCQYAVIETSSEGIAQHRHIGIDYDILVFTGLTPEHIESHGSFENYKNTKLKIFEDLGERNNKQLKHQALSIKRIIIANGESKYAKEFLNFNVDEKYRYESSVISHEGGEYKISETSSKFNGINFKVNNTNFNLKLLGKFNISNSLAVISVGLSQNIELEKIKQALEKITNVPGRMEIVHNQDFKVIVDYAYEPNSMENVYKEIKSWNPSRIITVFGGTGGGRDKWRRPKIGELAAKYCDIIILTTDDPYQDDPSQIIQDIKRGIEKLSVINYQLYEILDRKEAIKKAISLASKNDIVLVLGKGCEQKIALKDGYHNWDDRRVVQDCLSAVAQTQ